MPHMTLPVVWSDDCLLHVPGGEVWVERARERVGRGRGVTGGGVEMAEATEPQLSVALAARELAAWGFAGAPRVPGADFEPLNAASLTLANYESGRPSAADACRIGDPRVLARAADARER